MRFSFELDFLKIFRNRNNNKPQIEERSANTTSPFMGIFGRTTKSGVSMSEEGAVGVSVVG
jgi:hypothetical protein